MYFEDDENLDAKLDDLLGRVDACLERQMKAPPVEAAAPKKKRGKRIDWRIRARKWFNRKPLVFRLRKSIICITLDIDNRKKFFRRDERGGYPFHSQYSINIIGGLYVVVRTLNDLDPVVKTRASSMLSRFGDIINR